MLRFASLCTALCHEIAHTGSAELAAKDDCSNAMSFDKHSVLSFGGLEYPFRDLRAVGLFVTSSFWNSHCEAFS